jgi:hypothetical protein
LIRTCTAGALKNRALSAGAIFRPDEKRAFIFLNFKKLLFFSPSFPPYWFLLLAGYENLTAPNAVIQSRSDSCCSLEVIHSTERWIVVR